MARNREGSSPGGRASGLRGSAGRLGLVVLGFSAGVVVAGTLGLEFFPGPGEGGMGRAENRSRAELQRDLERLQRESSRVARDRQVAIEENDVLKRLLQGVEGSEAPLDDADRVLTLLDDGEWQQLENSVGNLLAAGERGFRVLLTAARVVVDDGERLRQLERDQARLALLKAALRNEVFVVDLIMHALGSEAFREDGALAERVLDWATRFVSVVYDGPETVKVRGTLVQILEKRLEEGRGIWSALNGLEALQSPIPADSILTLLRSPRHAEQHGVILKYLGERAAGRSEEAVELLSGFISAASADSSPRWELDLALQMLVRAEANPPAAGALQGFLRSREPVLAESAQLAYFSIQRSPEAALPGLIEFLNSGASLDGKLRVIRRARRSSPGLFGTLASAPDAIDDPHLREELRKAGKPGD